MGTAPASALALQVEDVILDHGADPAAGTASDTDGTAIRAAIAAADGAAGTGTVFFPDGTYDVYLDPAASESAALQLTGVTDVILEGTTAPGESATIVFHDKNGRGFDIRGQSQGITLRNLTLRFVSASHIEGVFVDWELNDPSTGSPFPHPVTGAEFHHYVIDPDPYFETLLNSDPLLTDNANSVFSLTAVDPVTRRLNRFMEQMTCDAVHWDPVSGLLRLWFQDPTKEGFWSPQNNNVNVPGQVGFSAPADLAVVTVERRSNGLNDFDSPDVIFTSRATDLRVEDVTIMAAPRFVAQHNYDSGTTYERVQVIPDPTINPPYGALVSSNRDGLHFRANRSGPTINECFFERCFDDPITIYSEWFEITCTTPNSIPSSHLFDVQELSNPEFSLGLGPDNLGDQITFLDPTHLTVRDTGTISLIDPQLIPCHTLPAEPCNAVAPVPPELLYTFFAAGIFVAPPQCSDIGLNIDARNDGFMVTDNTIRESRARGIYARGSNGTISGNSVTGTILGGIVCTPDIGEPFKEAYFCDNLVISDNVIHNFSYKKTLIDEKNTDLGGITVGLRHQQSNWPAGLNHSNVDIMGNYVSTGRLNGLFLASIDQATVYDNTFVSCQLDPSDTAGSARGVEPTGEDMGVLHIQHGQLVTREENWIDTEPFGGDIPEHTVASGVDTTGTPLAGDSTETGNGDRGMVFATSFEEEERAFRQPPRIGSGQDPASGSEYNLTGNWEWEIDGVTLAFSDWGLFGNHHSDRYYRGSISSRCDSPGGKLTINTPSSYPGIIWPWKVRFWAATLKPGGATADYVVNLQYELHTGGGWQTLATIDPNTLDDSVEFMEFEFVFPLDVDRIRFQRAGGAPGTGSLFFLDDLSILHVNLVEPPPGFPL